MSDTIPPCRNKLGLALAGGGFRASLFHLGVLRRMAELDLLRYVEVLSTVSGGSIIGALYILLLKKRLDKNKTLTRENYIDIVKELEGTLVAGIQKDLRTRLFMNPFGILRVLLTQDSLGKRMSRIYERYLYRKVVEDLEDGQTKSRSLWSRWLHPGQIPLKDVRFRPGGEKMVGGLEAYNRKAAEEKGSAVPNFILNATSLNSGKPFRFSSVEIGDPILGFIRIDEIKNELIKRKRILQEFGEKALQESIKGNTSGTVKVQGVTYDRKTVEFALWWHAKKRAKDMVPKSWEELFSQPGFPGRLCEADFGQLRKAKLAAWYIRKGSEMHPPVNGGLSVEDHRKRFWAVLKEIHEDMVEKLKAAVISSSSLECQVMDFVLELYYIRSAEIISPRIEKDWHKLTIGDAVGASACFPPVFPPFVLLGLYDDLWVTRLGLSDGGVYDNVGITTLLEEGCTYIIASDTGGLFDVEQRVSTGRVGMGGRIISILMNAVATLQRDGLRDRRRIARGISGVGGHDREISELRTTFDLQGLAFFHIDSPHLEGPGLDTGLDRDLLSRMRTDLDAFGEVEVSALVNHGYDMADRYIKKYLKDSPYYNHDLWQQETVQPRPLLSSKGRVKRILSTGHSRFFRSLKLGSLLSWLFTLTILGLVISKTWKIQMSVQNAVTWLSDEAVKRIGRILPWSDSSWISSSVSVGGTILTVIAAAIISMMVWPRVIDKFRHQFPRLIRKFVFAVKWIRSYAKNVLWLIGGAPFWIAFGGAVVAWISYIFYKLPFLAATKDKADERFVIEKR